VTRPLVVLVGVMGAGKSTVGVLLAERLGVAFRDVDTDIVNRAGKPISEIFIDDGEPHFRELEKSAVAEALRTFDGVLALGGGAILAEETRAALQGHHVVFLSVELADAVERVGLGAGRPLLALNPRATLRHLLAERKPLYASVAAATVITDGRTPDEVADEVQATLPAPAAAPDLTATASMSGVVAPVEVPRDTGQTTVIEVGGAQPYRVLVGRGLTGHLAALLPKAAQAAVLYAEPVKAHADRIVDALRAAGIAPLPIEVPDAEAGKAIEVAARCWDALGGAAFTRTDAVIGVGGGAVTDVAGFVAACWLRGVRVVQVPTSLLGMVDAAVGGKTGVNTAAGKNLVGAFHPPAGVLCDLAALDTLPADDLRAGLAEIVKCGFIADPRILELIEAGPGAALNPASPVLRELIDRAIGVKARVVSEDLHESGPREILNYGHTLGHAIERVEGYRWKHGHAVAVGMVYAAALGRLAGRLDPATAARHKSVLELVGLPITYTLNNWSLLQPAMRVDKKARGARLRFIVLDGLAQPSTLDGPDDDLLRRAYEEIAQ
jgi:shikimate kinase/3-dehydroquinate synthase